MVNQVHKILEFVIDKICILTYCVEISFFRAGEVTILCTSRFCECHRGEAHDLYEHGTVDLAEFQTSGWAGLQIRGIGTK